MWIIKQRNRNRKINKGSNMILQIKFNQKDVNRGKNNFVSRYYNVMQNFITNIGFEKTLWKKLGTCKEIILFTVKR